MILEGRPYGGGGQVALEGAVGLTNDVTDGWHERFLRWVLRADPPADAGPVMRSSGGWGTAARPARTVWRAGDVAGAKRARGAVL